MLQKFLAFGSVALRILVGIVLLGIGLSQIATGLRKMQSADREPAPGAVVGDFFGAVARREPEAIVALLHPSLAETVDPRLVARFFKGLIGRYGEYRGGGPTGMSGTQFRLDGSLTQQYSGTVSLLKLDVPMDLVFRDGLLAGLKFEAPVDFEALMNEVAQPPQDLSVCAPRAKAYLEAILTARFPDAYALLHPGIRSRVGLADFTTMYVPVATANPGLRSVEYVRAFPGKSAFDVLLAFRCGFEGGDKEIDVRYGFTGLVSGPMEPVAAERPPPTP